MKLSDKDVTYIETQSRDNQVHQYFDNIAVHDFKVGDYLIQKIRDYDVNNKSVGNWRAVKISPNSNVNKKFIVVHVDKHNVPYVKHIKVNGKLGGIVCTASINFQLSRFEPDPEYMEHIILDNQGEYDTLATYKEGKK